jgi:hypothetical protein
MTFPLEDVIHGFHEYDNAPRVTVVSPMYVLRRNKVSDRKRVEA